MSAEEAGRIARAAERLRRGTRVPLKVLLPTAAAVGAGGALAAAAIPGSNGVISGCYSTITNDSPAYFDDTVTNVPDYGALRVIDPSAQAETDPYTESPSYNSSCAPWEQTITWSQQGPAGPQGPSGSAGADGKNGSNASINGAATFEIDAGGGTELFAKLAEITGSSKLDGQGGLIALESFAFGAESTLVRGTGAGAGQTVQTFEFTKKDDKSDAELFKDWQQDRTISRMTVQADHVAKGKAGDAATFTFGDVKVKSIHQRSGHETVVGVFAKMQSSFGTGNSKVEGSLNPSGAVTYDLQTSKTG